MTSSKREPRCWPRAGALAIPPSAPAPAPACTRRSHPRARRPSSATSASTGGDRERLGNLERDLGAPPSTSAPTRASSTSR